MSLLVVIETLVFSNISKYGEPVYPLNQNVEFPTELCVIIVFPPIFKLPVSATSFATHALESIIFIVKSWYLDNPLGWYVICVPLYVIFLYVITTFWYAEPSATY